MSDQRLPVHTDCPLAENRAACAWGPFAHDCAAVAGENVVVPVENPTQPEQPEPDPMPIEGLV